MAGIRPTLPRWRAVGDDGLPLAGAKLLTYQTSTSTPKATYSDSGLTIANANPVVADAGGLFGEIFLDAGDYRFVLTDANDVTIWTSDPVAGASDALPLSGGTMTGPLVLAEDPVQPLEAATKQYVDRVMLDTLSITSATAAAALTVGIDDTFQTYEIDIVGIKPATDNANLLMQWSNNGGSSYTATNYYSLRTIQKNGAVTPTGSENAAAASIALAVGLGNASGENGALRIVFHRFPAGSSGDRAFLTWSGAFLDNGGVLTSVTGAAYGTDGFVGINALRIFFNSGDISRGRIVLRGCPSL